MKKMISMVILLALCMGVIGAAAETGEFELFEAYYFDNAEMSAEAWVKDEQTRAITAALMLDTLWTEIGEGDENYWKQLCDAACGDDCIISTAMGEICPVLQCFIPGTSGFIVITVNLDTENTPTAYYRFESGRSASEILKDLEFMDHWIVPKEDLKAALG